MITLILTSIGPQSHKLTACRAILDWQMIRYSERVNVSECMTLARGKINPSGGFVLLAQDGTVLLDAFELMKWIDDNGLRKI